MGDTLIKMKIIQKEWITLPPHVHGFAAHVLTTNLNRSKMPSGGR